MLKMREAPPRFSSRGFLPSCPISEPIENILALSTPTLLIRHLQSSWSNLHETAPSPGAVSVSWIFEIPTRAPTGALARDLSVGATAALSVIRARHNHPTQPNQRKPGILVVFVFRNYSWLATFALQSRSTLPGFANGEMQWRIASLLTTFEFRLATLL